MEREKIVREDYPVEKLPDDLREGLGDVSRVKVTVEASSEHRPTYATWSEMKAGIKALHAMPGFKPVTTNEAVARIRELRDEWD